MKKKILIIISILIILVVIVFGTMFFRKIVIIDKIKKNLEARSDCYYVKEIINGTENTEFWQYPNGMKILLNHFTPGRIVQNDTDCYFISDKKVYTDYGTKNVPPIEDNIIRKENFLPHYKIDENIFKMAINYKISEETINGRECYAIKCKVENELLLVSYIDKENYDLVRYSVGDSNNNYDYIWTKLTDNDYSSVEEYLDGYEKLSPDEYIEIYELYMQEINGK